jgi:hypothetical protein
MQHAEWWRLTSGPMSTAGGARASRGAQPAALPGVPQWCASLLRAWWLAVPGLLGAPAVEGTGLVVAVAPAARQGAAAECALRVFVCRALGVLPVCRLFFYFRVVIFRNVEYVYMNQT